MPSAKKNYTTEQKERYKKQGRECRKGDRAALDFLLEEITPELKKQYEIIKYGYYDAAIEMNTSGMFLFP